MKNIKLLIIISLFSNLLLGCGMKGPLYRAPAAQQGASATKANTEKMSVEMDTAKAAPDSCSENSAAANEQDKSENNSENTVKEDLDNSSENTTESN